MEEVQKKKFNWGEFIAVSLMVLFAAGLTFAATWWFMDAQIKEDQEVSDQVKANFESRIRQLESKLSASEEAAELTQTYKGVGYTLNYPATWVYRVYNGASNGLVAFASTTANLPAENSDQQAGISITTAKTAAVAQDLTSDEAKVTKETVTVGNGVTATKWTLAAGRTNDLGGEDKTVIYEVKLKDNTYIRITNVADKDLATFNAMLKSLKLS